MLQTPRDVENDVRGTARQLENGVDPADKGPAPVHRDNLNQGGSYVGTELFASVLVGALLGWFVGQLVGVKSIWPLLIGITFGAVAGFREIFREIRREIARETELKRSTEIDKQGGESSERPAP